MNDLSMLGPVWQDGFNWLFQFVFHCSWNTKVYNCAEGQCYQQLQQVSLII